MPSTFVHHFTIIDTYYEVLKNSFLKEFLKRWAEVGKEMGKR